MAEVEIKDFEEGKDIDKELAQIISQQKAKIKVIGLGGGGGNALTRMREVGIKGSEFIAINTDAQDLLYTEADAKILIGKELTHGLGAGSNPTVGEEAAHESEAELKKKLFGANMVFLTCGLGGGTGTGATPVVANLAKKMGMLTIAIVTLPFSVEGNKRYENALRGLDKLERLVDTLIVIPNDKLLDLAPDLPIYTAFKIADEVLMNAVKGITELVTKPGLVNLDFADIRAVMTNGGVSVIGVGESDSAQRAQEAVEKAMENPLLDVSIDGATGALVNISGGKDLTLQETKHAIEVIGKRLNPDAKLIWGAQISEDLGKTLRVLLIITGVKSPQILGPGESSVDKAQQAISEEFGIEFVEENKE